MDTNNEKDRAVKVAHERWLQYKASPIHTNLATLDTPIDNEKNQTIGDLLDDLEYDEELEVLVNEAIELWDDDED